MDLDQPKLIAEIQKRPGLWSIERPTDRDEKLQLWKDIGAAMYNDWNKITKAKAYDRVLYLQRKWRSLRDAYRRELRAQSTGVRSQKTVYRYFKNMSFLGRMGFSNSTSANEQEEKNNDRINHDSSFVNEEMVIEALVGEEAEGERILELNDTDPDPLVAVISSSKPSKPVKKRSSRPKTKKCKVEISSDEDMDDHQEIEMPVYSLDMRDRDREMDSDPDRLFLMSFLPEMKQLPLNIKMWARAQIANIMQEAISCQYNDSLPNNLVFKRQRRDTIDE